MAAHAAASIPAKQVNIMLGHPDGDSEADRYVTESQRQFMNRTDTHPGALSPRGAPPPCRSCPLYVSPLCGTLRRGGVRKGTR